MRQFGSGIQPFGGTEHDTRQNPKNRYRDNPCTESGRCSTLRRNDAYTFSDNDGHPAITLSRGRNQFTPIPQAVRRCTGVGSWIGVVS